MIIGIGTDVVDTDRVRSTMDRWGHRFATRVLSAAECTAFAGRLGNAEFLARQFAAKEAVAKALGTGMRQGVSFRTIEVLRLASGAPHVVLTGGARKHAASVGIDSVHISISDERSYAIAFAVAERQ